MKRQELIDKYPNLFPDGKCPGGICIKNGWMTAVDKLCANIVSICERDNIEVPSVQQVKEKFGGLRFYINGTSDSIRDMIYAAELECGLTCESCGSPGTRRDGGWIVTLCDDCDNNR